VDAIATEASSKIYRDNYWLGKNISKFARENGICDVKRIAARIGRHDSWCYQAMRVAENIPEEEFESLLTLRSNYGDQLPWVYIVRLSELDSPVLREQVLSIWKKTRGDVTDFAWYIIHTKRRDRIAWRKMCSEFQAAWVTSTVAALVDALVTDPVAMFALVDAFQEAGCENEYLLDFCRQRRQSSSRLDIVNLVRSFR
jgi:hypothetical protein